MSSLSEIEVPDTFKSFLCYTILFIVTCFSLKIFPLFFKISFFTGQILVDKLLCTFDFAVKILSSFCVFGQIVYEDALIFFKDVIEKVLFVISLFAEFYCMVLNGADVTYVHIASTGSTISTFFESLTNAVSHVGYAIINIKQTINSIGSFLWMLTLSTPRTVALRLLSVTYFINNTKDELFAIAFNFFDACIAFMQNLYMSFFHIQLDAIGGLFVGAVLLSIVCTNLRSIWDIVLCSLEKLYNYVKLTASAVWSPIFLKRNHGSTYSNETLNEDTLCIVCQVNSKEVIIFPCRHLCLCWDCSVQLNALQSPCPICRASIDEMLKVYI